MILATHQPHLGPPPFIVQRMNSSDLWVWQDGVQLVTGAGSMHCLIMCSPDQRMVKWSIPVLSKGRRQRYYEAEIAHDAFSWHKLEIALNRCYGQYPGLPVLADALLPVMSETLPVLLCTLIARMNNALFDLIGVRTEQVWETDCFDQDTLRLRSDAREWAIYRHFKAETVLISHFATWLSVLKGSQYHDPTVRLLAQDWVMPHYAPLFSNESQQPFRISIVDAICRIGVDATRELVKGGLDSYLPPEVLDEQGTQVNMREGWDT